MEYYIYLHRHLLFSITFLILVVCVEKRKTWNIEIFVFSAISFNISTDIDLPVVYSWKYKKNCSIKKALEKIHFLYALDSWGNLWLIIENNKESWSIIGKPSIIYDRCYVFCNFGHTESFAKAQINNLHVLIKWARPTPVSTC